MFFDTAVSGVLLMCFVTFFGGSPWFGDDSPLRRSAFGPLMNSCVSPLFVQYSFCRLTADVLPGFNLMFKCHGCLFVLSVFCELATARCLPSL